MFVRKKRNRSGSVSVQVVDKSNGCRVVKSMGASSDPHEIQRLVELGKLFIARQSGQYSLFPEDHHDRAVIADFVEHLNNASIRTVGPELIFGRLFDEIGFDAIPEQFFRDIVVARLGYPTSKLKTIDYLYRYQGKTLNVQAVYRFLASSCRPLFCQNSPHSLLLNSLLLNFDPFWSPRSLSAPSACLSRTGRQPKCKRKVAKYAEARKALRTFEFFCKKSLSR